MNVPQAATGLVAILSGIASLALILYWVVVGWRAMRALEEIAQTLREPGRRA